MRIYKKDEINSIEFELRNNKAAIVDTDTVIGIVGLDPKIIYKIKKRPFHKKLILFIDDFENSEIFTLKEISVLKKYWPGKLTVIKNKVGYRVPNNEFILKVLTKVKTLYSSSANISGKPPITNSLEAIKIFKKHSQKLIVVECEHIKDIPSTIINLDTKKVLRNGILDGKLILKEFE